MLALIIRKPSEKVQAAVDGMKHAKLAEAKDAKKPKLAASRFLRQFVCHPCGSLRLAWRPRPLSLRQ